MGLVTTDGLPSLSRMEHNVDEANEIQISTHVESENVLKCRPFARIAPEQRYGIP